MINKIKNKEVVVGIIGLGYVGLLVAIEVAKKNTKSLFIEPAGEINKGNI